VGQFNIFGAVEEKHAADFFSIMLVMLRHRRSRPLRNKTAFPTPAVPCEQNLMQPVAGFSTTRAQEMQKDSYQLSVAGSRKQALGLRS